MYVRVKNDSGYFRSMVYAVIGEGWFTQYIVLNPFSNKYELLSYLDKSVEPAKPLVEMIQSDSGDFKGYRGSSLLKLMRRCSEKGIDTEHLTLLRGYYDVCDNLDFMVDMLLYHSVPADQYDIERHDFSDISKWNYILTQDDADRFMEMFAGFHDSTIEKAIYSESYEASSVCITFDNTGWYGVAELCFEGVQCLKILPPLENCSREIYDASLMIRDDSVFWADQYMEQIDDNYSGSFVKALCLKWRKLDQN